MTLDELIAFSKQQNASDLIFSPGMPVGLRINGAIRGVKMDPLDSTMILHYIRSLVTTEQMARLEKDRELDFAAVHAGQRFRGNAYWRTNDPGLALRPIAATIPKPEDIGVPDAVIELTDMSHGLILFTGAAGQGKSTSQAALLNRLNEKYAYHIVTVEDPIEFVHKSKRSFVDQREVGTDTLTFANALRHILRQNPDVILVGEMRDRETMAAVLTVAETGHLVLSTLHTNDACQAIDRVIDVFPENGQPQVRTQLSLVLLGVVNQRLIPSRAGQRVLATEVLMNTHGVAHLIREGKTQQLYGVFDIEGAAKSISMNRALQKLVDDGVIDKAEAERHMVLRESRVDANA